MMLNLVDMNENFKYLPLVEDKKVLKEICWKNNFSMSQLEPYLGHLDFFKECSKNHKKFFEKKE